MIKKRNKYTIDIIKKAFDSENYILLSDKYFNVSQKLNYICSKGHRYTITWREWLAGHRCACCAGNSKLNINDLYFEFSKYGYKLLDKVYINSKQKLRYRCPAGHTHSIRIDHWRKGIRCPFCSGMIKKSISSIRKIVSVEGYELLSTTYVNVFAKMRFRCPAGHIFYSNYHRWISGGRCTVCSGYNRFIYEDIKLAVELEGYTLISSTYINSDQKLKLVCPNGHKYYVRFNNWRHKGSRCPTCSGAGRSIGEDSISKCLTDVGLNVELNNKMLIDPYELDIVIPDKKLAIEYCGLYWHSEAAGKNKNYHLNKLNLCNKIGYRLITIFEDEWIHKKDVVLSTLYSNVGVGDYKIINSSKCRVVEISEDEAVGFCNAHSLYEYTESSVRIGLFYGSVLVALMTFSKLSKAGDFIDNGLWVLSLFCHNIDYRVSGGARKLLSYFERAYVCKQIVCYADRRWCDVEFYINLGFKLVGYTDPCSWSVVSKKRLPYNDVNACEDISDVIVWDCGDYKFFK